MEAKESPELEAVLAKLEPELPAILAEYPVMMAYLYGSVAEGNAQPSSDVDIALILSPDFQASAYERMSLEFEIAHQIERRCKIGEVDVRSIDQAPLMVRGSILTRGVLVYSRDEIFRVDYEVYTRSRYFDFLPVDRMMREAFFERLQQTGLGDG